MLWRLYLNLKIIDKIKVMKDNFHWCMECKRSMWIAEAFEEPEEVYCTKKKIEIKKGDKIDCPYL